MDHVIGPQHSDCCHVEMNVMVVERMCVFVHVCVRLCVLTQMLTLYLLHIEYQTTLLAK